MLVTVEQLLRFAPGAIIPNATAAALTLHTDRVGISTPRRMRHFMAHLHVESAGFTRLEENLNYSAQRLTEVWPGRFPTTGSAQPFARNPRALANRVYGGRMGNTGPNDGWLFRGGGWIMLTGKANYERAKWWTGVDFVANPNLARTPEYASQIACDFWRQENLNAIVDPEADEVVIARLADHVRVNEDDDLTEGTRKINGGLIGLNERRTQLARAALIFN